VFIAGLAFIYWNDITKPLILDNGTTGYIILAVVIIVLLLILIIPLVYASSLKKKYLKNIQTAVNQENSSQAEYTWDYDKKNLSYLSCTFNNFKPVRPLPV